jgi:hypothetical protein
MFLLQSVFSHAKPPAQHILYFRNGVRYVLGGDLTASYIGSNRPYSKSFEILDNELFATVYEEKRKFIFFVERRQYKLKVDWFSGFIICVDDLDKVEGQNKIYESYKIYVFENGNLVRKEDMDHNEFIELRNKELALYKLTYNNIRLANNNEMDFWSKYFILAYKYIME